MISDDKSRETVQPKEDCFVNRHGIIVDVTSKTPYVFCGDCGKKLREQRKLELRQHAEAHGGKSIRLLHYGELPVDGCYLNLDWYFENPTCIRLRLRERRAEEKSEQVNTTTEQVVCARAVDNSTWTSPT